MSKENLTVEQTITSNSAAGKKKNIQNKAFTSLLPIFSFIKPYKMMLALALIALLLTSAVSLSLGQGIKFVIDSVTWSN